jgi:hypothetical protein
MLQKGVTNSQREVITILFLVWRLQFSRGMAHLTHFISFRPYKCFNLKDVCNFLVVISVEAVGIPGSLYGSDICKDCELKELNVCLHLRHSRGS